MGSRRSCSDESSSTTTTTTTTTSSTAPIVAVAVRGSNSNGSKRAVRWAIENLMPHTDRFVLVYVIPPITSIPTPSGRHIPINEMGADVVSMYRKEMRLQCEENFLPYKTLCKTKMMETLVLEDDSPACALLKYITESSCKSLVLGSSSPNYIKRKLKGEDVPTTVLKLVTNTCNIYVVSRSKLITKLGNPSSTDGTTAGQRMFTQTLHKKISKLAPFLLHSASQLSEAGRSVEASSEVLSDCYSQGSTDSESFASILVDTQESIHDKFGNWTSESQRFHDHGFNDTLKDDAKKREIHAEVEQLRIQLRTTLEMYDRACEDQVHIQQKVQALSSECVEEARKVHTLLESEEKLRRTAAEEKVKHLEAIKKLEEAKQLLVKEVHERQRAELNALTESSERQKVIDALFSSDKRYRRYTKDDIEVATNFFSKAKMIGEGGYGKVYKCSLDHTPVAIKVLQPDASEKTKKEEFLREVEVLSQLHHPNLVLLLGACPEIGCLVYEYMENGSLEERLFRHNGTPPLPWFVRFRIAFEVACGLTFLHNSEPEPIVHRDIKPGNILLDRNYGSKIGDVGLSKLMSVAVPDNITEYRNSSLAGTLNYMDPEYHRTGTLRPKSDLYSFGIIILQLLTARRPNRLVVSVENAINNISLGDILDKSVADWPLAEAEELARIALKCCRLRCRDRPDLVSEVLPVLEKLSNIADAIVRLQKGNTYAPSHYFCPILQEVMEDPYVASDGFTYEYTAIKEWLGENKVSPVTKLMLPHTMLTPNRTLRFAIDEWKKQRTCSSS